MSEYPDPNELVVCKITSIKGYGVFVTLLEYEKEGFKYHPALGISVQGQSAQDCWKEVDRLARKWRIPVTVEFRWRQNPKAQHPGKTGVLQSGNV